jgi:hypothetical protein
MERCRNWNFGISRNYPAAHTSIVLSGIGIDEFDATFMKTLPISQQEMAKLNRENAERLLKI